jgi:DNA-binding LacI/PurR family transcriptional regulator
MLPSRRELCQEFHTTQVTLDKAIQALIREGVLRAARGSGTFVSNGERTKRALRIGVVIKRDTVNETLEEHWDNNFYFGPLFGGIRDAVTGENVEIIYSHIEQVDYLRYCRDMELDGMILVLPSLNDVQTLHELSDAGFPYVATGFSTPHPIDAHLPSVDVDNRMGAAQAVEHLVELGHRSIATVNLALTHANHIDRLDGFQQAMARAGLSIRPDHMLVHPTYFADRFETIIGQWVSRLQSLDALPTAIFASDYLMSLATLRVLRRAGIQVPRDISLVGFDDPMSAADITPPLTAVRQPVAMLGRNAVLRLIKSLQPEESHSTLQGVEVLPTKLIIRESTAPPRAANKIVSSWRYVSAAN